MKKKAGRKIGVNWKVIAYSLIGFGCIALAFMVDWMFLIGTVICIYLNQIELGKKR